MAVAALPAVSTAERVTLLAPRLAVTGKLKLPLVCGLAAAVCAGLCRMICALGVVHRAGDDGRAGCSVRDK